MERIVQLKLAVAAIGVALVTADVLLARRPQSRFSVARFGLTAWAAANIAVLLALCVNHVAFPLNLDLMESVVLQHAERAAAFQPIYPAPSPEYVPLAYNALYYVAAIPFVKLFGPQLFSLRILSILGLLGSGGVIFLAVRRSTRSAWWGFLAAGIFAAAYRVMDVYLDTAHSDSWLLCSALSGTYAIALNRSRAWNLAGVMLLVAAFWFKQHGALFAIGGVLYLTYREGPKKSWPYWLAAAVAGPAFYIFAGPALFGTHFHYFTWEVPRQWSELNRETILRYALFIGVSYPVLALAGAAECVSRATRDPKSLDIWRIQFAFAMLSGFMGALDPGSSDNVFIPMGAWFIVVGVTGIFELTQHVDAKRLAPACALALFAVFATLTYNPAKLLVSPKAGAAYDDLLTFLRSLNAPVYAPSLGQLPQGFVLTPAAHWVAVEDMIRGPGRDTRNHPETRRLLHAVLQPAMTPDNSTGVAYILSNRKLDDIVYAYSFLSDYYVLDTDLEDRFLALRTLPKRWEHRWPRYLYRYAPK